MATGSFSFCRIRTLQVQAQAALMGTLLVGSSMVFMDDAQANTTITHDRVKKGWVGERIELDSEISDDSGIDVARVYFKVENAADYNFVPMLKAGESYQAVLPAPSDAGIVNYLILVKNGADEVRRTEAFDIKIKKSRERGAILGDRIEVYTELADAPTTLQGFSDSITIDLVESTARYGIIALLYGGQSAESESASSTNATNAGVVSSGGGVSTAAIVAGIGLAAAGVALVASGNDGNNGGNGGGGDGGGGENPPAPPPPTEPPLPEAKERIFTGPLRESCDAFLFGSPEDTGSCNWSVQCRLTFSDSPGEPISGPCTITRGRVNEGEFYVPICESGGDEENCSAEGVLGDDISFSGCSLIRSGRVASDAGVIGIVSESNSGPSNGDSTVTETCTTAGTQLTR